MPHSPTSFLALVFAAAIGLALGTFGGGGSVLTVPVLVYLLRYDPKIAVPTSLGVVGAASLMGAASHWRSSRVDARIALSFGIVTMIGAYTGAWLAFYVPGEVQLAILSVVMIVAAILMLRRRPPPSPNRVASHSSTSGPGPSWTSALQHAAHLAPVGLGVGLLTGLIGVGGGFLIVPALVLWGGVEMPTAVGTSLVVITMNCATSLLGYVGRVQIPWGETILFTAVAVGGAALGAAVVGGVPPRRLRQAFAVFLLGVGGFVLYRNRGVFLDYRKDVRRPVPEAHR
jgi:uncharacterized protein